MRNICIRVGGIHTMDPEATPFAVYDAHRARINWYKTPTLNDFVKALQTLQAAPTFCLDLGLLIVDHETNFRLQDIAEARRWIIRTAGLLESYPAIAITVFRDCQFETATMLSIMALGVGINMRAFRDVVLHVDERGNVTRYIASCGQPYPGESNTSNDKAVRDSKFFCSKCLMLHRVPGEEAESNLKLQ